MTTERSDLLQGTLEMLVLHVLAVAPMHGWGIAQRLEQMSGDVFAVNQGSLYPALQRLKRKGWIRSEWLRTDNNRKARYYELTQAGKKQLARERAEWAKTSAAVNGVLAWAGTFA
jgi:PadR family transcriptional regulator PadR